MNRHACSQAALDNGYGSVAGYNQLECGGLTKVAIPEPRRFDRRGSFPLPAFDATLHTFPAGLTIGRMIRAFGADDVAPLEPRSENYVFR
jgi:hypothetical protein